MSSETSITVPPMLENGLVLPRFIPSFLLCFPADFPAKYGIGVDVWSAAIVFCSVVTEERDTQVKPLVYGNESAVRLYGTG